MKLQLNNQANQAGKQDGERERERREGKVKTGDISGK
jgi:hypothetical protein